MNKIIDLLGLSEFKKKIISLIPTKISQLDNDSEYAKKEEINDLKKSVSDGKKLVADAITDKGVETAADAEFATMADNIEQIETSSKIVLQGNKDVHPTTSIQVIKPDNGYDGLSQVTLDKIQAETKTVTPSAGNTTYYPDTGRFFSSVTVNAVPTQTKTVNPTTVSQTVKPDTGKWLSQVTVNAINNKLTLNSFTSTGSSSSVKANVSSHQNGYSQVTLNALMSQEKTISPSTSAQTITPDSGYDVLSKVIVNAAKLQNKSVTPTSSIQTIKPDSGFYGLGAVSIAAIPGLSTVEKLGNTNNLTIIPDGYSIYCFICPGMNDGKGAPYYGTVNSEGYINRFDYSYDPKSSITIYVRVSVFDSSIGGTTPITKNARMICYGFK